MAGRILDLLSGDRIEESQRNMKELIDGTDKLIAQMKSLTKALQAHRRTMKELMDAIEGAH